MLLTIERRLDALADSGELERIEEDAKYRYKAYAERPRGVRLPRARETRAYYIDPSITVPYDITDNEGHIIHQAGTTVNPLEFMNLSKQLLFFDGDDPVQVEWALKFAETSPSQQKLILINGPILKLMNRSLMRLHFDQGGRLSQHIGIQAVPAVINQKGLKLYVQEVGLKGPE